MNTEQEVLTEKEPFAPQRFHRWLPLLLENARKIVYIVVVSTAAAAVVSLLLPVRYQAETRLLPSESGVGSNSFLKMLGGMADAAIMAGYSGVDLGSQPDTGRFIGILRSRTIADRLIDRFSLMKVYGTSNRQIARNTLQDDTVVSEERKTGQIVLRVTDRNAKRAADLAQAYIEELNALNAQLNTTAAHREREFLEQRIKEVNTGLNAAAEQLSRFSKKNTMLALGDQQKAMLDAAARLQGELMAARADLSGLQQLYSESNYRVREARARVDSLSQELQALRGRDTASDKSSLFPPIRDLPELGVTYAELYKQVKTLQITSEMLSGQLEVVKTQEVKELPVIRVLDPPEVPPTKSWPPRKLIVLTGFGLSFLAALSWVLVRQAWRDLSPEHEIKVAVATARAWWGQWRPGAARS